MVREKETKCAKMLRIAGSDYVVYKKSNGRQKRKRLQDGYE